MAHRGPKTPAAATLTADEFALRFQREARVFWTLAAGLVGDPSEADDILQEAVLAALSKLDRFDRSTNFLAWMGRFVRNVASNQNRKRGRRQTTSADPVLLDGRAIGARPPTNGRHVEPALSEHLPIGLAGELGRDRGDFDDDLLAGLRELGEVPRSCLLLRAVLELSYAEIADALAIPPGTAMSHVHRSRVALRARLTGEKPTPLARRRLAPEVNP